MKKKNWLTKSEVLVFKKRWEVANAFEKEELRGLSYDGKLARLMVLMATARELNWTEADEAEIEEVRGRWRKLEKVYHAKKRTFVSSP